MHITGHLRRIVGAVLAAAVLAALVSPTAASPIVRKMPRVVVDGALGAGPAVPFLRTADGNPAPQLWLAETSVLDGAALELAGVQTHRLSVRAPDLLEQSAFGSRPPPASVRATHDGGQPL